jgi:hypothetical protein
MVAITILAEAFAQATAWDTVAAWDAVAAQGMAVRVHIGRACVRVNGTDARPQTRVQSFAFFRDANSLEAKSIGLLPQAPLAEAFGYALRHWEALIRYTENGVLLPDNNALERQIRPIALGRSNWLFAGSPRGARAAATMYSLIGTARPNGIEPYAWLKRTLERLPSYPVNRVHALLPLTR